MRHDFGLRKAIETIGSGNRLAKELGIARQAITQWSRIPADRVIEIERLTGIPREELRPDLHPERPPKLKSGGR